MKKILFLILSVCFSACTFSQKKTVEWECKQLSQKELNKFSVLSECYGYVRFFYPNPHTKNFNWTKFLMYSVSKIEKINNDDELKNALLELFKPICPQISFSTDSIVSSKKRLPPCFALEHKAIGSLAEIEYGKNYSPIVCITENADYKDTYCYKLKENLYVNFPIAVKELSEKTAELIRLKCEIDKIDEGGINIISALLDKEKVKKGNLIIKKLSYRIADVIVRRNFVRHFYPYFSEDGLSENWDRECMKTIAKMAEIDNTNDYYKEICRLLATVKDSHIRVWNSFNAGWVATYVPYFYPAVSLDFINDTCFVNVVGKEYENQMKQGDIVLSINKTPIENAIQQNLLETSCSTRPNGLYKLSYSGKLLESAKKDSVFAITLKSPDTVEKSIQVKANMNNAPFFNANHFFELSDNHLVYVNLCSDSCTYENFAKKIPVIQVSKGVIFDLRGYPQYEVLSIISHFIREKIELGNLLKPVIRYPNQENVTYEAAEKWYVLPAVSPQSKTASKKNQYKEPLPVQIEKPLVFLTNGKTMSFGETFAEMVKFYKIGTLAGTHTAGCNGDATRLPMKCADFFMRYHKFLNRDGSQHHGIGVLPDINCEMQLSDIQRNIDTQLEKAKELFQ
jgi:hypothetical protein